MMNFVCECVRLVLEVVLKIVYVEVAIGERLSWCEVEVSNDLVDTDATLETATLLALSIEVFRVVLTLALLDAFTTAERPRDGRVGFTDFIARITAARLDGLVRRWGAEAFAAVVGIEVGGFVFVTVFCVRGGSSGGADKNLQIQCLHFNRFASFTFRRQPHLIDTVCDAHLQFAGDVHNVKCDQLARYTGERNVHGDLHLLSYSPLAQSQSQYRTIVNQARPQLSFPHSSLMLPPPYAARSSEST
jgi:hypothetical protein